MSKNTDHPSKQFITIGGALRRLEDNGVDGIAFMQRIISDPKFRMKVVELHKSYSRQHEYVEFDRLDDDGATRFLYEVMGLVSASPRFTGAEVQSIGARYTDPKQLMKLINRLDPRSKDVFRLSFGLDGSGRLSPSEIAQRHDLSTTTVGRIMSDGFSMILHAIAREQYEMQLSNDDSTVRISDLNLSERAFNCLRRARIDTMRKLLSKSEDELLAITNFGQGCLDNVVEELAKHNLRLRAPDPK